MMPTMRERPLRNVRDLCFSRETVFKSVCPEPGAPRTEYPAAVDDRGKRLEAKSKAETE